MKTDLQIISSLGNKISLSVYKQADSSPGPAILYLHGFKGFKDWGFGPFAGEFFAKHGFTFIAMNFSHNGIGDNPVEFTEEDKFRDNTFSLELDETKEIINAIALEKIPGLGAVSSLGLLGHSRGGGIALLAGLHHPMVDAVCTWAAVSFFNRYPPDVISKWQQQGYLDMVNQRTGQVLQLGWNLHADLMEHLNGKLNIRQKVESSSKPLCVIHGSNDESIPFSDAENLYNWSGKRAALHEIKNTGHTFGIVHPFAGTNEAFDQVLAHSLSFFREHLNQPA